MSEDSVGPDSGTPPADGTSPPRDRGDALDAVFGGEKGGPSDRPSVTDPETRARHAEYWRRNLRYVGVLVAIWFVVSYGFGIVLAEPLNAVSFPGTSFPLGFWFAQQGSIYVFVVLIFVYVKLMNALDQEFDVDEGADA